MRDEHLAISSRDTTAALKLLSKKHACMLNCQRASCRLLCYNRSLSVNSPYQAIFRTLQTSAPVADDIKIVVPSMGDSISEGTVASVAKQAGEAFATYNMQSKHLTIATQNPAYCCQQPDRLYQNGCTTKNCSPLIPYWSAQVNQWALMTLSCK